ncbi:Actin/actin-like protein [Fistulina hepatica ATCC 64428]|nr:Actin/actin-like protein [Fistulina hepatica ATCC 64428]
MVAYGGDEVSALVLDIGTSSVRAGYAGDDTPKAVISTSYGYETVKSVDADVTMGDATSDPTAEGATNSDETKYYFGDIGPSVWRANMAVGNPMGDSLIEDFAAIPGLINTALVGTLRCKPEEHPIMVTEPPWNTSASREKMAEILFEEFQVPAFYIANTGVLSAFAAGKGSALVIDIGQSASSVTPVVDGFVLRKGMAHSSLPRLVHEYSRNLLAQMRTPVDLTPRHLISNRQHVDLNQQPIFDIRKERVVQTTASWRTWAEQVEVEEWIQTVAGVLPNGWNDHSATDKPKAYEFATGFSTVFGAERFMVGEQYFHHPPNMVQNNPHLPKTIPALISDALRACDVELRQVLMASIVVTGGGSLLSGLVDRLDTELKQRFPYAKIHAPGNPIERRFGGWLGGSILASLGTFHQLWISKEEWEEHGKPVVAQRCK